MPVRHYDINEISIVWNSIPLAELGDGDVTVTHEGASWTHKAGWQGGLARARASGDKFAKVTVPVLQGSETNELLSAALQLDEKTGMGAGPFQLRDNNGTTIVSSAQAWLEGRPEVKFGGETGTIEWTFVLGEPEINIGLNRLV